MPRFQRLASLLLVLLVNGLEIGERVALRHGLAIAYRGNLAVLDEHCARAVAFDRTHVVRDQNHRLRGVLTHLGEVIIAFALECLVTHGQHLVEHENVALGLDGHRERQANLHAARVVLELLIHELPKFGELHDVVVHRVHFLGRETEQCAVQIHVLATGELRVEAHAELDERHEFAGDVH